MLSIRSITNIAGISYPADPNAIFEPGMIAQLKVIGNAIVMGVSDGRQPIGIIDDINTNSFTKSVVNEVVILKSSVVELVDGQYKTRHPIFAKLSNANLIAGSAYSDTQGIIIDTTNGTVEAPVGTVLNYSTENTSEKDALYLKVSYRYFVPSVLGADSTMGTGMMTIRMERGIYATDQFEPGVPYPLNAALYCSRNGRFTTKNIDEVTGQELRAVAFVTAPPQGINGFLELMWH